MKKYFIVTILLILIIVSCGLFRSKSSHYGEGSGYGSGGNSHTDSTTVNFDSLLGNDDIFESLEPEPHKVVITSGEGWYPKPPNPNLKIVKIENTRVINKSVDMSDGRVVYKIPERMKIRETSKVLLRISKSKATVSVYDNLDGTVRTSEIPVTQTMEVNLIDPSPADNKSFEIVPDNNAVQIVDDGETYTEWSWNVTPVRAGSSSLKIVVSVIRDGNKKDVVYEDSVVIERDLQNQISFFWGKYWQWLIGTFLLPFFLWLYKRKKDKKEEERNN
jgi:hypothetical protein